VQLTLTQIRIPPEAAASINPDYVQEFADMLVGRRSNVSPEAWFADVTFVPDERTLRLIRESCEDRVGTVPIIESHPKYGLVFHTLLAGDRTYKKRIAAEFVVTRAQAERQIEDAVCRALSNAGVTYCRQVECDIGIADIVTPSRVYEVKPCLDASTVFKAIGQALAYAGALGGRHQAVVIGELTPAGTHIAEAAGVLALDYRKAIESKELI